MNKEEALEMMETSVDIKDWNAKREIVKHDDDCGGILLVQTTLDQNGMCGKVLKKNIKLKRIVS